MFTYTMMRRYARYHGALRLCRHYARFAYCHVADVTALSYRIITYSAYGTPQTRPCYVSYALLWRYYVIRARYATMLIRVIMLLR